MDAPVRPVSSALGKLKDRCRRLARSAFGIAGVYLAASVVAKSATLLLIPLYTRTLTLPEYGDLVLAQTLVAVLPVLLSLGLSSAVARFFFDGGTEAEGERRVAGVARWLVMLAIGNGLAGQLLLWLLATQRSPGLTGRWEMTCILWASVGAAVAEIPATYMVIRQRPYAASGFQFGRFLSSFASGWLLVYVLGHGLRGAIESLALTGLIDGCVSIGFIAWALKGRPTRSLLREGLRFSLPIIPHYLANTFQGIADRWTLKAFGLEASLGGYGLANQITVPSAMVVTAWNTSVSPRMGELTRKNGVVGIAGSFPSIFRSYVLTATAAVLVSLAALPAVAMLLGKDFRHALWLTPLVAVCVIVDAAYYPNVNLLFYANRTRVIPLVTVTAGLANVVLNVVFIGRFGVIGAILARFTSTSLRSGWMWVAARRCMAEEGSRRAPGT